MFPVKRLNKPVSNAQHPGRGLHLPALLSEVMCTDMHVLTSQNLFCKWPQSTSLHLCLYIVELERLQAEKNVEASRARLEAYNREILQRVDVQSVKSEQVSPNSVFHLPAPHPFNTAMLTVPLGVARLAQAVQDSILCQSHWWAKPWMELNGNPPLCH